MFTFTFIIVDYLSAHRTIQFVHHIIEKTKKEPISFVIVDNSINENNWSTLKTLVDSRNVKSDNIIDGDINGIYITLCKSSANGGYAIGNNEGAKLAKEKYNPDFLIITNNDIICLDEYLDYKKFTILKSKNEKIALMGPSIVGKDGNNQSPQRYISLWERWIRMSLLYPCGHLFGISADDIVSGIKTEKQVYRIMGSFMIFSSDAFFEVKGFDEGTFLFAEESIIAEKLKTRNYLTYYLPDVHMLHDHGATINGRFNAIEKLKQRFRSEIHYYKKYIKVSKAEIIAAKVLFEIFLLKYRLVTSIKRNK